MVHAKSSLTWAGLIAPATGIHTLPTRFHSIAGDAYSRRLLDSFYDSPAPTDYDEHGVQETICLAISLNTYTGIFYK